MFLKAEEVLEDTTTPQILYGHDGIKYSSDPTSEFGGLLVSVDREVVDVDNAEFTRQLVLVPKKPEGPELKRGEEVFRMAEGGVFDGYFVGIKVHSPFYTVQPSTSFVLWRETVLMYMLHVDARRVASERYDATESV
jgi:hypothetical protein